MNHVKRIGILTSALATAALMACGGSSSNARANDAWGVGSPNTMPGNNTTPSPNSQPEAPGSSPRSTYMETYPETPSSTPPPANATTPGTGRTQQQAPVVSPPYENSGGGGTQSPGYPVSR